MRSGNRRTKGPEGSPSRCKTMLLDPLELSHSTETATSRPSHRPREKLEVAGVVLGEDGSDGGKSGEGAESWMPAGLPSLPTVRASLSPVLTFVRTKQSLADGPPSWGASSMSIKTLRPSIRALSAVVISSLS